MKKYGKALANIVIAIVMLLAVFLVVPRILVFFLPFVMGWIIAMIASPFVHFFENKFKIQRKAGSAFVIIAVIGLVVLVMYLAGAKLVEEIVELVRALPEMWEGMKADFNEIGRNLSVFYNRFPVNVKESINSLGEEVGTYIGDALGGMSTPTINAVSNFAKRLPAILIGIIMALLSSYFFVAEDDEIKAWLVKHTPTFIQTRYGMLKHSLVKAVGGYLKAQLRIEVWMYLLLVIGLTILQVEHTLLIALGIAFLDFFPFFGTGTVMVPWAILRILSGDYTKAIGLLIIWGVGQLARQLIQPKIVGDSVGVPPIPTLFLLYIGYKFSGVVGMIIAVPVGLIVYTMYEEGVFDTTRDSLLILWAGVNRFRRLDKEDMEVVEEMRTHEKEMSKKISKQEDKHAKH
ncbi:MAG: sporulation integral membrane protein YtvI [Lachnospiraceae bacterium]|nr:sporulation integral membrane protein YtvI [Lachnospiraceae bacterium]